MKIKNILAVLLSVAVIFCTMPFGTFTASAATNGYYTYTITNGKATITDCSTSISGNVIIPSTLDGYPFTSIGPYAFEICTSLTTVYYCGTNQNWNKISFGSGNSYLTDANRYYHLYDNSCDADCNTCGYTRIIPHGIESFVNNKFISNKKLPCFWVAFFINCSFRF